MKTDKTGSDKKSKSDNLIILILLLVILAVSAWTVKNQFDQLNSKVDTLYTSQYKLEEENSELYSQLEKSKFLNKLLLQETILRQDIANVKVSAPKNEFSVEEKSFNNAAMLEKNKLYMNKIQNHGANVSIEYISVDKDENIDTAIMYYTKKLSDEICAECTTDYDKAYAIALWVSKNICYNKDEAIKGIDLDTISLESSLALHRTTCAGYSNLFSALCEAQGIYCINLRGSGLTGISEMQDWDTQPVNHEWNGVYCDGKWYFVDTTWASLNEYYNGEEKYFDKIEEQYLMMDFYRMSLDRRIDIADHREFFDAYNKIYG